jgi:hypothetical protein
MQLFVQATTQTMISKYAKAINPNGNPTVTNKIRS